MVNTAGPHKPMPLPPSTPIALIAMSVALVTSATSAMRPWWEIVVLRSRIMRAISAITIGASAASASSKRSLDVDGAPRASAMPWYTRMAARPSTIRSAKRASRPSTEVGSERTRKVASSATTSTNAASRTEPWRASTTMNANEMGSAARSGGLSSISSPAAIAPPIAARGAHGTARVSDLDPDRDRRAPEHEDEHPHPASHDPAACSS